MKKIALLLVFVFFFVINTQAKYTQSCVVRYMTKDGWSKKYTVNVSFYSGSELNKATNSFKYSSFSVYAIIFWDNEEATVIKISSFLICSEIVDSDCITNTVGDLKGADQDGDSWKICISDYCY